MQNLPTTKQLRYFVALERHLHFGRAAEACFVSQPAFSVAIRQLETLLGPRLVDRTKRSVILTSLGKDIAAQAKLVLRDLEGLVELAEFNQSPLCGKLNMGVIPTIAPFLLPRLLPRLRRSYPNLQLYLHEDQTLRVYDKLITGDLDVILIALPFELRNVESKRLFDDPFHLACRKNSKLFNPESQSIDQLPERTILLLEDGHCLREHAMAACRIRNMNKVSNVNASSLLTLVEMVDADLGVTYLPEIAVDSFLLKHTQVKTWPVKAGGTRKIGLVWRKGSVRGREFAALGAFIKENR